MQHDDPERALGRLVEQRGRPVELRVAYAPRLLPPRPDGVEPDDEEPLTAMDGLRRFPEPLELRPRAREPGRKRVRDVVVPGDREHGPAEPAQQVRRRLELVTAAAVREIAARDHELRLHPLDERGERVVGLLADAAADVQIGDVKDACRHGRGRLYTRLHGRRAGPRDFDDLYLGLRAGGALRKRRRGEPLTSEEEEALGRWERLSKWRKAIAVGAFSAGTFGLGFTLGGLIFGRWRRAKA